MQIIDNAFFAITDLLSGVVKSQCREIGIRPIGTCPIIALSKLIFLKLMQIKHKSGRSIGPGVARILQKY
jgi:hypothetical protein